ncbi:hypothetical protein EDB86DRAFT_2890195 [Lactarius hatsudake]|nr:hypothetical protein EDB86DRAFT_2890195 [Lactarius hatsudake]
MTPRMGALMPLALGRLCGGRTGVLVAKALHPFSFWPSAAFVPAAGSSITFLSVTSCVFACSVSASCAIKERRRTTATPLTDA